MGAGLEQGLRDAVVAGVLVGGQVVELRGAERVLGELEHRLLAAGVGADEVEVGGEGEADGLAHIRRLRRAAR